MGNAAKTMADNTKNMAEELKKVKIGLDEEHQEKLRDLFTRIKEAKMETYMSKDETEEITYVDVYGNYHTAVRRKRRPERKLNDEELAKTAKPTTPLDDIDQW